MLEVRKTHRANRESQRTLPDEMPEMRRARGARAFGARDPIQGQRLVRHRLRKIVGWRKQVQRIVERGCKIRGQIGFEACGKGSRQGEEESSRQREVNSEQ